MQKLISSVIVIFSIVFISCKSSKAANELGFQTNPPFKVEKATYSKWVGGQPGVHGISIQIQLNKATVELDSVYFRNNSTKLKLDKSNSNITYVGSMVLPKINKDLQMNMDSKKEFGNAVPDISQKIPFQLAQNEAIVSYIYNNKTHYYKISEVIEVKSANYKHQ